MYPNKITKSAVEERGRGSGPTEAPTTWRGSSASPTLSSTQQQQELHTSPIPPSTRSLTTAFIAGGHTVAGRAHCGGAALAGWRNPFWPSPL